MATAVSLSILTTAIALHVADSNIIASSATLAVAAAAALATTTHVITATTAITVSPTAFSTIARGTTSCPAAATLL